MFSINDYLKHLFSPPPQSGHYLNLSDGQVSRLLSLRRNDDFDVYLLALDRLVNLRSEALLASQDVPQQTRLIGQINGLREAARLIDEIHAKETHADAEHERTYRRQPDAAARRLATFGSPAWSALNSK